MMSEIEESILKAVIYFDTLLFPLKEREIFENLHAISDKKEVCFFEFKNYLKNLKGYLENKNGFWLLRGREFLIREREKREVISKQNFKKLGKIAKKIKNVPFIKGIFVSGSLSISNSTKDSDIDLLIIVKKGRIFTVRFFLTLLLNLIGERRKQKEKAQKICLNHYLTDESLEVQYPSLYKAYTYLHLLPILNKDNIFERFRKENSWIKNYILFTGLTFRAPFTLEKLSKFGTFLEKKLSGSFGDFLEKKLKKAQIKRKEKKYPRGIEKGRVILEDNLIELHPNSPEEKILNQYQDRLNELLR